MLNDKSLIKANFTLKWREATITKKKDDADYVPWKWHIEREKKKERRREKNN